MWAGGEEGGNEGVVACIKREREREREERGGGERKEIEGETGEGEKETNTIQCKSTRINNLRNIIYINIYIYI